MIQHTGRTIIGSIVFIDIVGFSKQPDSVQMSMKARLNDHIREAVAGIAADDRLVLDTGDGAALCFLGDPEDALFVATAVGDAMRAAAREAPEALRIGINLGPVKIVKDLNGRPNMVGDGINVAQRVMSFAGDNEILVSRSYYEVVARLTEGNENLFRYLGVKTDKHVREHQIYAFAAGAEARETAPGRAVPAGARAPAEPAAAAALDPQAMAAEEQRLARVIGPLAKVIVRRAAASARSAGEFYEAVAAAIPDEADRSAFLAKAPAASEPERAPAPAPPPAEAEAPDARRAIAAADLKAAERRLAEHIGPLAGMLVKKAAAEAANLHELHLKLAESIADPDERERFLAEVTPER